MTERNDSLITIIKAKVAAKALSNRVEFNGFRWLAEDEVFEIIRQHTAAPDAMERVTQAIKKVIHNSHGLWEPEDLANAAIAAMNMGDASAHKDEAINEAVQASPVSDIASEISVVKELRENIDNILHIDYSSISAQVQDILELIYPYLRTAEPVLKVDAAEALSKAILEAHAKWQAKYQGVGHVD